MRLNHTLRFQCVYHTAREWRGSSLHARFHDDGETSCEATDPPVCFAFSSSSRCLPIILAEICDDEELSVHELRRGSQHCGLTFRTLISARAIPSLSDRSYAMSASSNSPVASRTAARL